MGHPKLTEEAGARTGGSPSSRTDNTSGTTSSVYKSVYTFDRALNRRR